MREILFRGKRTDTGEWVCGNYAHTDCFALCNDYIGQNSPLDWVVDPSTVVQYTGMEDMNGNKIFEGDILRQQKNGVYGLPFEVIFEDGAFTWRERETGEESDCGKPYMKRLFDRRFLSQAVCDSCEVIGNIHDNPELLEVSQ